MPIVAQTYSFVVGVDTHARHHTYAILSAAGQPLGSEQFPTTDAGIRRALAWVGRTTGGGLDVLWVVECVATYGSRVARTVAEIGYEVVEAEAADVRATRRRGKSDPLDAHRIASAVLLLDTAALRRPRADQGIRAAVRVLTTAREHMSTERAGNVNALTGLLRAFHLGLDARRPLTGSQISEIAAWRARPAELANDVSVATARAEAVRLAKRIRALDVELSENQAQLRNFVEASPAGPLLEQTGIGPVTAAVAYAAWSHRGRIRTEAAFAALAGASPIPASSGNTVRHRLNRGGDRRLNRALHMAVVTRMTHDPQTRAYVERRRAEGRTNKEIRRCLKRYLARRIYRSLNATSNELGQRADAA